MKREFKSIIPPMDDIYPLRCSAAGCPLNGTLSNSSGDGAKYYCPIHFNNINIRLTHEIMERKSLIEASLRAMNLSIFHWERNLHQLHRWVEGQQRIDLLPKNDEMAYSWGERIFRLLKKECLANANLTIAR